LGDWQVCVVVQMSHKRDSSEIEKKQIGRFVVALEPDKQGKDTHYEKRCVERCGQFLLLPLVHVVAPAQCLDRANTASLYLRQPLLRSPTNNWYGQLQYDAKDLNYSVGSTATATEHRLHNVVLGINGDWQDALLGGSSNSLSTNLTSGQLRMDDDSLTQDAASAQSAGHFNKLGYQMQRLQALRQQWSLALSLSGQLADKNLASAEKFSLGGSSGVRAYAQGEGSGDAGWLASVALRWQLAPGWQLQTFYDAGTVKVNQQPWSSASSNREHLAGAGPGVGWGTDKLAFSLTSAWATEGQASNGQHGARLWAQATLAF
jgi:hemolysin activation/secretion protein